MYSVKRFTQSVTWILVLIIVALSGYLVGLLFNVVGLTKLIDSLWGMTSWFWLTLVASRLAVAAIWGFGDFFFIRRLHKGGWFWFKESNENHSYSTFRVDKSGWIILCIISLAAMITLSFVFGELAIRGITCWFWLPS